MSALWQDIVYALRILARKPLFTAVAALSLALGIGLNTAIFTLMNTILIGSLPYRDADRLVAIFSLAPAIGISSRACPFRTCCWKEQARSFEAYGAISLSESDFGAEENGVPAERVEGENVTPGLLRALGAPPLMGRYFTESDDEVDHPAPVILISHRLWMRRFGGDQTFLSRKILVNGENTSIIGVMPPDFRFTDENADYLAPIPLNHFQLRGSARFLMVAARLKPGVTMRQAQSEMDAISAQLAEQFPARDMDHGKPWTVRLQPIREALFGFISRPLLLLQGAVGFVLLIACANVAALLLARASSRQTEVAIRVGAGRGPRPHLPPVPDGEPAAVVAQWSSGSRAGVVGSARAGRDGPVLAAQAARHRHGWARSPLQRRHFRPDRFDFRRYSRGAGIEGDIRRIAQGCRRAEEPRAWRGHRLRAVLVAGQLALALMLLIGSGLLIRSFLELQGADLGCDPHGLLTFRYRFPEKQFGKPVGTIMGCRCGR